MNLNQNEASGEDILSGCELFCTGTSYVGDLDERGNMHGLGMYRFRDGTEYHGNFKHGVFHGDGYMSFPNNFKVRGRWDNGKVANYEIVFPDDFLYVEKDWTYCTTGDRRYVACIRDGMSPVGDGYLTKDKVPRAIPGGCYDTEEGFYDPKKGLLYSVDNPTVAIRVPSSEEDRWIVQHCRKAEEVNVGCWRAYDIIQDMKEQIGPKSESDQCAEQSENTSDADL